MSVNQPVQNDSMNSDKSISNDLAERNRQSGEQTNKLDSPAVREVEAHEPDEHKELTNEILNSIFLPRSSQDAYAINTEGQELTVNRVNVGNKNISVSEHPNDNLSVGNIIAEAEKDAVKSTLNILFKTVSLVGIAVSGLLLTVSLIYSAFGLSVLIGISILFFIYSYNRGLK